MFLAGRVGYQDALLKSKFSLKRKFSRIPVSPGSPLKIPIITPMVVFLRLKIQSFCIAEVSFNLEQVEYAVCAGARLWSEYIIVFAALV